MKNECEFFECLWAEFLCNDCNLKVINALEVLNQKLTQERCIPLFFPDFFNN